MTVRVRDLIAYLQKHDPELPVAYQCCSEAAELELKDIEVTNCCLPRNDGWVANKRPDKPSIPYLVFPGN